MSTSQPSIDLTFEEFTFATLLALKFVKQGEATSQEAVEHLGRFKVLPEGRCPELDIDQTVEVVSDAVRPIGSNDSGQRPKASDLVDRVALQAIFAVKMFDLNQLGADAAISAIRNEIRRDQANSEAPQNG